MVLLPVRVPVRRSSLPGASQSGYSVICAPTRRGRFRELDNQWATSNCGKDCRRSSSGSVGVQYGRLSCSALCIATSGNDTPCPDGACLLLPAAMAGDAGTGTYGEWRSSGYMDIYHYVEGRKEASVTNSWKMRLASIPRRSFHNPL